jgi:hypothetical protein
MGYTTEFSGKFKLNCTMKPEHAAYLEKFSMTRRIKRDAVLAKKLSDKTREKAGLPLGAEAGYFTGGADPFGQGHDFSVVADNSPPSGQPGLWCQWVPTGDRKGIEWDGGEKFYEYKKWLSYIIKHFIVRWGYCLNGEVKWRGEGEGDDGVLVVKNNKVSTR